MRTTAPVIFLVFIVNIFTVYCSGRATDSVLALAPLMLEFKWTAEDFDKLAAGGRRN